MREHFCYRITIFANSEILPFVVILLYEILQFFIINTMYFGTFKMEYYNEKCKLY